MKEQNKMKKLMIAAAIVCAAALSQAATFIWTSTDKAYGPDLANLAVGHMGLGSDYMKTQAEAEMNPVTWTFVMTLGSGDNTDELSGAISGYTSNKIKVQNLSSDLIYKPAEGSIDVPYSIIITGNYTDANGNAWTFTSDEIKGSAHYTSMTSTDLKTAAPAGWNITGGPSPSPIPEPTSGLLLLLGVAGLALRRRRA